MPIRLIAIDLDGTLLTRFREVHPRALDAIHKAVVHGIQICLASGRNSVSVRRFFEEVGITGHVVSCNGAYSEDSEGRCLNHAPLSPDASRSALHFAAKEGIQVIAYSPEGVFLSCESKWSELYVQRVRHLTPHRISSDELLQLACTKVLYVADSAEIDRIRTQLPVELGAEYVSSVVSEPEYLEFLAPGVNKVTGIRAVTSALGVAQSEVAAIGDYENDLEMLRWAGFSAAVSNGHPEVLAIVDKVVSSNDEGGVADFIDSIVYNL